MLLTESVSWSMARMMVAMLAESWEKDNVAYLYCYGDILVLRAAERECTYLEHTNKILHHSAVFWV